MSRITLFRIVAVLSLMVAATEVYACAVSDTCISSATGGTKQSDGCDQPQGDNCFCCCHHLLPVSHVYLTVAREFVENAPAQEVVCTEALPRPIDHPPQL